MKNSFRRLALVTASLSAFSTSVVAQDAPSAQNPGVVAGTLPGGNPFGPPALPRSDIIREDVPHIPAPPPRTVPRGSINIGPFSVRESDRDRRRAGCRWTVKDEMVMRRCRF